MSYTPGMRLLLALPLIVLPGAQTAERAENKPNALVVRAGPEPATPRSSIETAKSMWEIATAPTGPQAAPAEPEAPEAPPTAESAAQAEPEPERAEPEPEPPRRVVFAPTPEAAIVIRSELPPDQRRHSRGYYQRAAERCLKRPTAFARRKCLERVAAE